MKFKSTKNQSFYNVTMETWNLKYILFCSFAVKLLLSQSQQRKSRLQEGLTVYWDYRCRKTLWKLWYLFLKCHLKTTERGTAKELEWEQFTFSIAGAEGGPTSPPGLGGTGQGGQALALWCLQTWDLSKILRLSFSSCLPKILGS